MRRRDKTRIIPALRPIVTIEAPLQPEGNVRTHESRLEELEKIISVSPAGFSLDLDDYEASAITDLMKDLKEISLDKSTVLELPADLLAPAIAAYFVDLQFQH